MRAPFVLRLALAAYVVAEVALFVLVVRWIGGWPAFLIMAATSLLGGWLIRKEGLRVVSAVRDAARNGRLPDRAVADTRTIMFAGLLLVLPGFLSDVVGLVVLAPPVRPLARRALGRTPLARRVPGRGVGPRGPVVRGEVVDPERD